MLDIIDYPLDVFALLLIGMNDIKMLLFAFNFLPNRIKIASRITVHTKKSYVVMSYTTSLYFYLYCLDK